MITTSHVIVTYSSVTCRTLLTATSRVIGISEKRRLMPLIILKEGGESSVMRRLLQEIKPRWILPG